MAYFILYLERCIRWTYCSPCP